MSYKCDRCNKVRHGFELEIISEIRNVCYNRVYMRFDRKERKNVEVYDGTFRGTEIANIDRVCGDCYEAGRGDIIKVSPGEKNVKFIKQDNVKKEKYDKEKSW